MKKLAVQTVTAGPDDEDKRTKQLLLDTVLAVSQVQQAKDKAMSEIQRIGNETTDVLQSLDMKLRKYSEKLKQLPPEFKHLNPDRVFHLYQKAQNMMLTSAKGLRDVAETLEELEDWINADVEPLNDMRKRMSK